MAKKNTTPEMQLIAASYEGELDTVSSLLEKGTDPNAGTRDDGTALYSAVRIKHKEIVALLLESGADADGRAGEEYYTPLCYAASSGQQDVVRMLLEHGADPTFVCHDFSTPLSHAVRGGQVDIARLLIRRGAKLTNGAGESLTQYVNKWTENRDAVLALLQEHARATSGK